MDYSVCCGLLSKPTFVGSIGFLLFLGSESKYICLGSPWQMPSCVSFPPPYCFAEGGGAPGSISVFCNAADGDAADVDAADGDAADGDAAD